MSEHEETAGLPQKKSQLPALLLATAGLITAFGSFFHKQPEDAAKAGYLELTSAILASQEAQRKNHEDLVSLRTYFDEYIHAHEAVVTPVVPVPLASAVASSWTPLPPQIRPAVPQVVHVTASSATPPPPIAPLQTHRPVRNVDSFAW